LTVCTPPIRLQTIRDHPFYGAFHSQSTELGYAEASRLVVAVSGGGDSVALALIAATWAKEQNKDIVLAYFDHETDFVRNQSEWCLVNELSCALSVLAVRGSAAQYAYVEGRGSEEKWRNQRYQFLRSLAGRRGIILTGHTMNDAAETFLLAGLRGGSGGALSGIRRHRNDGIVRPLLGIRREQLRDLLQQLGVEWVEDRTNSDQRGPRVFVRQRILPLLVSRFGLKSLEGLVRSARWFEELNDLADTLAEQAALESATSGRMHETRLDLSRLRTYHPAVQRRVLRKVLAEQLRNPCSLLSRPVDELVRLLDTGATGTLGLPEGLRAHIRNNMLVLERPGVGENRHADRYTFIPVPGRVLLRGTPRAIAASTMWRGSWPFGSFSFSLDTAILDSSEICGSLQIRRRQAGERFRPLGSFTGTVKLKKYLRDRGIPISERWRVPVVTDASGELLWIPGIARSDRARVTKHTRRAILLRALRNKSMESHLGV
jgi:tRNA(Ile)-lysidine synthase